MPPNPPPDDPDWEVRGRVGRRIAKAFDVPEQMVGLPTPWHRRWWQRLTRKPSSAA